MKKLKIAQAIGETVITVGVTKFVGNVIQATMPGNVKVVTKICMFAGTLMMTDMLTDQVIAHTERKAKEFVELCNSIKNKPE